MIKNSIKLFTILSLTVVFSVGSAFADEVDDHAKLFAEALEPFMMGEYENADCSGSVDSLGWAFITAFGMVQTLEIDGDSYTISTTMMGNTEQTTGTFTEEDGSLCLDGLCLPIAWETDGQVWLSNMTSDAYCEDANTMDELSQYTDQSSCEDSGNDWYDESCTKTVWTNQ